MINIGLQMDFHLVENFRYLEFPIQDEVNGSSLVRSALLPNSDRIFRTAVTHYANSYLS